MTKHSTLVGGSTAARLLNCPGSHKAISALPPQPDVQSAAAAEGTHCHHIMDMLLRSRMSDNSIDLKAEAAIWVGDVFHDRELSRETLDTLIFPAIDALHELEQLYGGDFHVAGVEQSCQFPGVTGAFGTVDLVLRSASHVIVLDYKFGGVEVPVVYVGEDGEERLNPQLLYYACAARYTHTRWFARKRDIVLAIVQPRAAPVLRHARVYPDELDMFEEDIFKVVTIALSANPPIQRGTWCAWCPAKPSCPEWLKPLIEFAAMKKLGNKLEVAPPSPNTVSPMPAPYGEHLARAKELSELVKAYADEVDKQLEQYLRGGGLVPGWALAPKQKQRKWVDPAVVVPELIKLGFRDDEIWKHELQTFAVTDAAAKKRGKTIPPHLRAAPPSDEVKIVRAEDHKSFVDSSQLLDQLKASVALIDSKATGNKAKG